MIRDFLKEGTIYTLAGFMAKGISLALIPVFTTYFSPNDYGILDLLYVFSMFFAAVFSFQIGQGLTRYLGESHQDTIRKRNLSSTALVFIITTLLLGGVVAIVFRKPILDVLGITHPSHTKTYILAVVSIILNGMFLFFSGHLQALRRKVEFSIASFLHALLGILATYFFVIVLDKGINGVFYATIAIVPVVLLYQFFQLKGDYQFFFSKKLMKKLLKYSLPLVPAAVAYVFLTLTDRICINYFLTKTDLGVYSVGYKFSFAISLIVSGFSTAMAPLLYQRYKEKETKTDMSVLFNWYVFGGLFAVTTLSVFAEETIILFTQKPFYQASDVMPMLYLSVWFSGLSMFAPGMNLQNRTKWIAGVSVVAAVLNIGLNIWLIPVFGIKGAALATLGASIVNYVAVFVLSRRFYRFEVKPFTVMAAVGVACVHVLFTTSSRLALDFGTHTFFFKIVLMTFVFVILIIVFRLRRTWFLKSGAL